MTSRQPPEPLEQTFTEAGVTWNLPQLYSDLTAAKQQYKASSRQRLTVTEKAHLRGLLCGYSPPEIAAALNKDCAGLRVELSRGLYRYLETLTQQRLRDWKDIPAFLSAAGYKQRTDVLLSVNSSVVLDWPEAMDTFSFYGRTTELATLCQWILSDNCRVVAILGMPGIGKTALASKLAQEVKGDFEYIIGRSIRHSLPLIYILTDLIYLLSDNSSKYLDNLLFLGRNIFNISSQEIAL